LCQARATRRTDAEGVSTAFHDVLCSGGGSSDWECTTRQQERRCHLQLQHESDEGDQSCNIVDTFTAQWVLTTRSTSLGGYECACVHGNLESEWMATGGSSATGAKCNVNNRATTVLWVRTMDVDCGFRHLLTLQLGWWYRMGMIRTATATAPHSLSVCLLCEAGVCHENSAAQVVDFHTRCIGRQVAGGWSG